MTMLWPRITAWGLSVECVIFWFSGGHQDKKNKVLSLQSCVCVNEPATARAMAPALSHDLPDCSNLNLLLNLLCLRSTPAGETRQCPGLVIPTKGKDHWQKSEWAKLSVWGIKAICLPILLCHLPWGWGGQWNGSSLFYLLVKCRQRHRYLGAVLFTRVQERSVISNTSLPLAWPVGWAETFQHETFRLLWCWDASGPHLGTSIWPYPIC